MSADTPQLAHHFDSWDQQHAASVLGMWMFLATEVLFFGGLFAAYTVYRAWYPETFSAGSHHLDVMLGSINTTVLISSSLTMALAVHAAQLGRRFQIIGYLLLTMLLGGAFLGIKAMEWYHDYEQRLIPGVAFDVERLVGDGMSLEQADQLRLFFVLYFAMTGLHAAHMIAGMAVIAGLMVFAWRNRFSPQYYTPVELTGLYWHFVDIVWIFLFPMFYLVGTRHFG